MKCLICPNKCNVDRKETFGKCLSSDNIHISKAQPFYFEEPCISGTKGSGNIFFSNCNLKCIYCQNYEINTKKNQGKEISVEQLADIMLKLQKEKVHNINLVTPTIYAHKVIEAIKLARKNNLTIPIIYNSSGYESLDTLDKLDGNINIYLPDFKYFSDDLGHMLSNVTDYATVAKKAIRKMVDQVGTPFFENGLLEKGVIVRHLVLPNQVENTIKILEYLKREFKDEIIVSLMFQYFPTNLVNDEKYLKYNLNRKINEEEFKVVLEKFEDLNFKYGYFQEMGSEDCSEDSYVPTWEYL